MKTLIAMILAVTLLVTLSGMALAAKPDNNCTTIKDGLVDSEGRPLVLGYDQFGYNYQAHMFNGRYCDYDRVEGGASCDVQLIMKWSDTWMSNMDCNGDGKLDRGYSCDPVNANSSACEGAWLTNHQRGTDEDGNWTYYVKIVCPPGGVVDVEEPYGIDDNTGAPIIWGGFIVLQEVWSGEGATNYAQPVGFGAYK